MLNKSNWDHLINQHYSSGRLCFLYAIVLLSSLLLGHNAIASTTTKTGGDAVYRETGILAWWSDHGGVYNGDGEVYEITGYWPLGSNSVILQSWSDFLDGDDGYGAFCNLEMTSTDRENILDVCEDLRRDTDITYTSSAALYHEDTGGRVDVYDITDIRCDGVVEYAYEKSGIWVWGKAYPVNSGGTPRNFDISLSLYCEEHDNLGYDQPWFELSPRVQRGGSGTKWTKLRLSPDNPVSPYGFSASDGTYTDRIRVSWDSYGIPYSSYQVYRSTSSTGTKVPISSWQTSSTFDDDSVTVGTTYYYWVKGALSGVESPYSSYNTGWRAPVITEKYVYAGTTFGEDYANSQIINPRTSFTYPEDFDKICMAIRLEDVYRNGDYSPLIKVKSKYYRPDGSLHTTRTWSDIRDPRPEYSWFSSYTCYSTGVATYGLENYPGRWTCKIYIDEEGGGSAYQQVDTKYIDIIRNYPSKAASPNPSSGSTGKSINTDISWSNGGGATSYDVYFGTDSTPDSGESKGNQAGTSYNLGTLSYSTTYYWRIDSKNTAGTTTGDIWQFTTEAVPVGSLTVIISPQEAIDGGAQWRLSSGPDMDWKNSGQTISGITIGSYTLQFKEIAGWFKIDDRAITISQGVNNHLGEYIILPVHTITVIENPNGTIAPNGIFNVIHREDQHFTATPDMSYTVAQWLVDGSIVQIGLNEFKLENIQAAHTVEVSFMPIPTVVYVDDDNISGPWNGTQTNPYQYIQDGVNVSSNGTEVIVEQGIYYENVVIDNLDITLTSIDPNNPDVVGNTIIDGSSTGSVVTITDADLTMKGFTITNGLADAGGGISCENTDLFVNNCSIINNNTINGQDSSDGDGTDAGNGGGIYLGSGCSLTINDSSISFNTTGNGGASNGWGANKGNAGNGGDGAGIYCDPNSVLNITNSSLKNNSTGYGKWSEDGGGGRGGDGAAIFAISSELDINACDINSNNTGYGHFGDGIEGSGRGGHGAGMYSENCLVNISHSVVQGNSTGSGGNGYVLGTGGDGGCGAAIYSASTSPLIIDNCIIKLNNTGNGGGGDETSAGMGGDGAGLYCLFATIVNSTISNNTTGDGGSTYSYYYVFGGNGGDGAGIYCHNELILVNCIVNHNITGSGGTAYEGNGGNGGSGAGVYILTGNLARFTNCTISNNINGNGGICTGYASGGNGGNGGGIYSLSSFHEILNSIVYGNSAGNGAGSFDGEGGNGGSGGGIYCQSLVMAYSCLFNNNVGSGGSGFCDYGPPCWDGSDGQGHDTYGGATITDTLYSDPLFVDPSGSDYHLLPSSPCIDAGDNSAVTEATDFEGRPRILDGDNNGTATVDIGAFEYTGPVADAGPDQVVTDSDSNGSELVMLDGSGSVDPHGIIVSYVWTDDLGDTIPNEVNPTATLSIGIHTVTLTVTDNDGYTDTDTVLITVYSGVNSAPVLAAIGAKSGTEGLLIDFTASASDTDFPANNLTFSLEGAPPAGASIDAITGYFTWTPTEAQGPNTYNVTVRVTDDGTGNLYDEEVVSITVNETNVAPVLDPIADDSVDVGSQLMFTASSTDTDVPANTLAYSLTAAPAEASIDSSTGVFTWTAPNGSYGQTHPVTVRVTDDGAGNLFDEEAMTITVTEDQTDPFVTNLSPAAASIEKAVNTMVVSDIVDADIGVDPATVTIDVTIDAVTTRVYSGDVDEDSSSLGTCRRTGSNAAYKYVFQPTNKFDFDEDVTIDINASDLAGTPNAMAEYSYTFTTMMRSFGEKKTLRALTDGRQIISSGSNKDSERPLTSVTDSSGNVWAAWTEGDKDGNNNLINRDIYLGKIIPGTDSFENGGVFQVTNDLPDQGHPVLAIDSSDNLYLVWQDQRLGNWDLYMTTSSDGINWSNETRITDLNYNQTNPAMAVNSNGEVYIVYDDDQSGDKDIYIASSADNYVVKTRITSAVFDQTTPDIAIDDADTVYAVWADARNWNGNGYIKYDIYGATSENVWTNIEIIDIAEGGQQTSPKIATEDSGTVLHFVWEDDGLGDLDIYYASSNGLPGTPLIGTNIIDQGLPADVEQKQPALVATGSGANAKVFACWEDERYGIENLFAVEITNLGTNIWVGDDGAGTDQKVPTIGIDQYNEPFLVWVNNKVDIIYSRSTFEDPNPLVLPILVDASANTIVGNINSFSATFPAGAYVCDMDVSISLTHNPPKNPLQRHSMLYEFGPSNVTFGIPVTLTIPFSEVELGSYPYPYWYDPVTGQFRTDGISDITYSSGVASFKTTHFTGFGLGGVGDLISIALDTAQQGDTLSVTITGQNTNFTQGSTTVWFMQGSSTITGTSPSASSDTSLIANIDIQFSDPTGLWDVHVYNDIDGELIGVGWFTITENRNILYVDNNATGANDGSSWTDAFTELQSALDVAISGDSILVAAGTYKPDYDVGSTIHTGDRTATFQLINGVALNGGYAGFDSQNPYARNTELYETILSGDLNENDVDVNKPWDLLNESTRSENSYHVVTGGGTGSDAILSGFTIMRGNANGSPSGPYGGGMHNHGGSPTVINCTFTGNSANNYGGGMTNGNGSQTIVTNCRFIGNAASGGGGMFNIDNSSPTVTNCIFVGNSTGNGGGMYNYYYCHPMVTNCTFIANTAGLGAGNSGGGMFNQEYSDPLLSNCIFWANTDKGPMDESAQITNILNSTPVINYSCVQGWTDSLGGEGNIGDNPLFADPNGVDGIIGTEDDNLRLMSSSPCIDDANDVYVLADVTVDLDGLGRIIDGDCDGSAIIDMGAYEFDWLYVGDFAGGCDVDLSDFAVLAENWQMDNPAIDIAPYPVGDGMINLGELMFLAEHWLEGTTP